MNQDLSYYIKHYFNIVNDHDLNVIISFFKLEKIKKNEYFLEVGKESKKLSFINSGLFRIYTYYNDKEVTQWISNKGYFITDLSSFVFNTPARWNIQALTDTEIYTIRKEDYQKLVELVPSWHEIEKLFIAKCFTILEERVFSFLSMSAEERYEYFFENNKELFNQVPLQYIASMLGMTPETFSRVRKKMSS